jgi:type IV secretion system protein VirB10
MRYLIPLTLLAGGALLGQDATSEAKPAEAKKYVIEAGTRIPMTMLNSVSTKHAVEGDRVYLETLFPVLVDGRIVVPAGSSIAGSVTSLKRPGRVKGKGELYVRFDTLILPNGTSRDFRSRLGAIDGRDNQTLDREEGKIKGESDKSGDAVKIGTATTTGATVGGLAGAVAGRAGMGVGSGAAAGAAAALTGILGFWSRAVLMLCLPRVRPWNCCWTVRSLLTKASWISRILPTSGARATGTADRCNARAIMRAQSADAVLP